MHQIIEKLNEFLQGWVGYFRIHEFKQIFGKLDEFTRNRLRSMQLKKWKKPKKFQRMMVRSGQSEWRAKRTWVRMDKWQSVARPEVKYTLKKTWFRKKWLIFLDDFRQRNPELKFSH